MRKNPKIDRLFCVFCWLGTLTAVLLEGYMIHLMKNYPKVDSFARNVRVAGVLVLVWIVVSTFFTIRMWMKKEKK